MNLKKFFKRLFITLFVLIAVISLTIGVVLNVVFTPEKITPIAEKAINDQLKAEVHCDGVELTFFSTFPRFGAKLRGTYIKSLNTGTEKDTLATFSSAVISFNLYQYLKHNNIVIKEVKIDKPKIYAFMGEDGRTNWDVMKATDPIDTIETDTSSLVINDISIEKFEIDSAYLAYEDEVSHLTYRVNSFSLHVKAAKEKGKLHFAVLTDSKDVQAYYKGRSVYKLSNIGADMTFDYDSARGNVLLASKDITVNDIHFKGSGTLIPKPKERKLDVNLKTSLATNSIDHFLALVPRHILSKEEIETSGKVKFDVDIIGSYGNGELPEIDFVAEINDGSLAYKNFPGKITTLSTAMEGKFYPKDSKPSYVNVKNLRVKGTGIDIEGQGNANDITQVAQIKAKVKGDIDLTELYKKFPMDTSVMLRGKTKIELNSEFSMDQIQQEKYHEINASGIIDMDHVVVLSRRDSLLFFSKSVDLNFYREQKIYNKTAARLNLDSTELHYKYNIDFKAKKLEVKALADKVADRKAIINVDANMESVKAEMKSDSLTLLLRRAKFTGTLHPSTEEQQAYLISDFTIDSVGIKQASNFVGIRQGSYHVRLDKKAPKIWLPKGNIQFTRMFGKIAKLDGPVFMPATKLTFENDNFTLDHTTLKYKDSDVTLTGKLEHAIGFFRGTMVTASLDLEADYINANQLFMAFAGMETSEEETTAEVQNPTVTADSTTFQSGEGAHAFRIPDSLQFNFTTRINKLKLGYSDFDEIQGNLKVKNGNLYLNNFKLKTLAANLDADVVYTASDNEKANIDFKFYLTQIEMSKLNQFLPPLDTLFPMSKSFVGKVDFRVKGKAELNENLEMNTKTFKGIGALKARDIMVMDGPTFTELAKTFMFKNKELNPIESLEAEMEFEGNDVNILPAVLEIDRYKLALGGTQHLDMTFDYHISVLESPVPFKTGVDVSGDVDDYNIKVTKAKYKYYFTDKKRLQDKADSTIINKKASIKRELNFN
ncbi:hypothetical protein LVD15_07590 [Fulvivirga maritima]|uniref:AsmA family protein n=1 Tax=Fulvivirga maritima TaxID=2904247 RepID=UPI001F3816B0|nr:AsmA-like C-terminal region-containing protein [Fulvivirga maritima]UII28279.1 hypothetical protein LVD15_07590 [Fulvivirga maritima]